MWQGGVVGLKVRIWHIKWLSTSPCFRKRPQRCPEGDCCATVATLRVQHCPSVTVWIKIQSSRHRHLCRGRGQGCLWCEIEQIIRRVFNFLFLGWWWGSFGLRTRWPVVPSWNSQLWYRLRAPRCPRGLHKSPSIPALVRADHLE